MMMNLIQVTGHYTSGEGTQPLETVFLSETLRKGTTISDIISVEDRLRLIHELSLVIPGIPDGCIVTLTKIGWVDEQLDRHDSEPETLVKECYINGGVFLYLR